MKYKVSHIKPFGVIVEPREKGTHVRDLDLGELRKLFRLEQIVVLRGFETFADADSFSRYCDLWGEVSLWPFGKVLELVELENPSDHIFDHSYMPLHWDGMFRPQVPEYQIFHCVKAPLKGHGGRTTFSHTTLALENTPIEIKELWGKVTGTYERKMEFYNSKTISPIVTKHPFRDISVIRYNEPHFAENGSFVNPSIISFTGVSEEELALFQETIRKALYSPKNFYAHEWQKGDVVITDNFSLLHGREEFVSQSPRHIQRVQVLSDPPFANPCLESYQ